MRNVCKAGWTHFRVMCSFVLSHKAVPEQRYLSSWSIKTQEVHVTAFTSQNSTMNLVEFVLIYLKVSNSILSHYDFAKLRVFFQLSQTDLF